MRTSNRPRPTVVRACWEPWLRLRKYNIITKSTTSSCGISSSPHAKLEDGRHFCGDAGRLHFDMLASMTLARFVVTGLASVLLLAADEPLQLETADYVVGFLRKGPNPSPQDTPENRKII